MDQSMFLQATQSFVPEHCKRCCRMLQDLEQCQVTLGHSRSMYVPWEKEREREWEEEMEEEKKRERERKMAASHGRVYVGGYLI